MLQIKLTLSLINWLIGGAVARSFASAMLRCDCIGAPCLRRSYPPRNVTQPARKRRAGLTCAAPLALGGEPRRRDVNRAMSRLHQPLVPASSLQKSTGPFACACAERHDMLGGGALRASPTEGCERQGGSRKYVRDADVASETRPYGRERREGKYKGNGNVKTRAVCPPRRTQSVRHAQFQPRK